MGGVLKRSTIPPLSSKLNENCLLFQCYMIHAAKTVLFAALVFKEQSFFLFWPISAAVLEYPVIA